MRTAGTEIIENTDNLSYSNSRVSKRTKRIDMIDLTSKSSRNNVHIDSFVAPKTEKASKRVPNKDLQNI